MAKQQLLFAFLGGWPRMRNDGLQESIESLSDFQATKALEELARLVSENGANVSGGTDDSLVASYRQAAERDASAPLAVVAPGATARSLLQAFAADTAFAPLVEVALHSADDTQLATKPILAVGVAATLMIVAATTDVKVDVGNVHVHKTTASAELVENLGHVFRPIAPPQR